MDYTVNSRDLFDLRLGRSCPVIQLENFTNRWFTPLIWGAFYFALTCSNLGLLSSGYYDVVLFWLPSGVYFVALLQLHYSVCNNRQRRNRFVFLTVLLFMANWIANWWAGNGSHSFYYSLINSGEAYLLFVLWVYFKSRRHTPQVFSDIFIFSILTFAAAFPSGFFAALVNPGIAAGWDSFVTAWSGWSRSVLLGFLLVGFPFGFLYGESYRENRKLEAVVCFLLLTGATWLAFSFYNRSLSSYNLFSFLLVPFMIWAALRFNRRLAALAVFFAGLLSTLFVNIGGAFTSAEVARQLEQRVFLLQMLLVVFGVITYLISAVITGLQRAHAELKNGERRFRLLAENARDGLFRMSLPDGKYQYLSPAVERITGIPLEEMYRQPAMVRRLVPDNWQGIFDGYWKKLLDGEFPDQLEFPIIHKKTGKTVWISQRNTLIFERKNYSNDIAVAGYQETDQAPRKKKVVAIEGIVTDITARRLMEEKIKESNDRLMLALRIGKMMWWEWNSDTDKIVIGAEMNFFTGSTHRKSEYSLKENINLIHPDDRQKLHQAMDRMHRGDISSNDLSYRLNDNGRWVWVRDISEVVKRDSIGSPQTIIGILINIDSQKRLELKLLRNQKLESLGVLAGGIAHDFNNVLSALAGNISLAMLQLEDAGLESDRLVDAECAVQRAQGLTGQLLTFSKGGEPVCDFFDLIPPLKETVNRVLHGTNVTCIYSLPETQQTVFADRTQFLQAIHNAVENALESMNDKRGELMVKVSTRSITAAEAQSTDIEQGSYLHLQIKDNGRGMDELTVKQVFDPYFTTKRGRTGLGLAVTWSVLRSHSGGASIKSLLGKGTELNLYLPDKADSVNENVQQNRDKLINGNGESVLVMDDDPLVGATLQRMVTRLGYNCEVTENGEQALALYRQSQQAGHPFECVIMDLTVNSGMGGVEAVRELHRSYPDAKVVVSSGYSNDSVLANYREYGFYAVLVKPVVITRLADVLAKAVE